MRRLAILSLALIALGTTHAAELQVVLPSGRAAYQTNEMIDVSVIASDAGALPAADLDLSVTGLDGSRTDLSFPLAAVPADGNGARLVEHIRLNARLLRPGKYELRAECHGAAATASFELFSHVRRSTFRLLDWGGVAKAEDQLGMGERGLGFNVLQGGGTNCDDTIRAGMDYLRNCSMGGGHTLDLRKECDWSDGYVAQGAAARVTSQALADRTMPNTIGVHFYDEQGLISAKHPQTGDVTPHNVPQHERAFRAALDREPPQYYKIDPANPADVAAWVEWGRWKELFMDATWKKAAFGVHRVRPDFITVNQCVWAWDGWTHGHYFNEIRSLDAAFGHGKYSWANYAGYYLPVMSWEFGRIRDPKAEAWHLPSWYSKPGNLFRQEQYMTFQLGVNGLGTPPWLHVHRPRGFDPEDEWCAIQRVLPSVTEGVVESNKRMARLGTIFTNPLGPNAMPPCRPKAAVLYSLSNNLRHQAANMKDYNNRDGQMGALYNVYVASKMAQLELQPIVDEDVLDGTLAAHYKAVVLAGIESLDQPVVRGLEAFSAAGGTVITTDDCSVKINGAKPLGVPAVLKEMSDEWKKKHANLPETLLKASHLVVPLRNRLAEAGISPVFECDQPGIFASRHGGGDVEYLFATNATWDPGVGEHNSIRPVAATIALPADGRPVYDAVLMGEAKEFRKSGGKLKATLRFGPGQMRVFARTARPIGGVQVLSAGVVTDYLAAADPVALKLSAVLTDDRGRVLAGSAPMQVVVLDPLGQTRHDVYRAAERGVLDLSLSLAANDPRGEWKVAVRELLAGNECESPFEYRPPAQCGSLAGAAERAIYFADDREKIFTFFAQYEDVSVVAGSSDYSQAAAARLADVLKPLDIRCTMLPLAEAAKPRTLTEEEAATWCGLTYTGSGSLKPGDANNPQHVGFNLRGPVVLIGNPEDNPLIAFAQKNGFLAYKPNPQDFPGPRRGYVGWQRDAVGYGQESVTLIAYDAAGMGQAAGTVYAAASGITPLMPLRLPGTASVTAASRRGEPSCSPAPVAWQLRLPDRVRQMKVLAGGDVLAISQDGTLVRLRPDGKIRWQQTLDGGQYWFIDASADGDAIAVGATQQIFVFDGKGRQKSSVRISPGGAKSARLTCIAVSPDGTKLFAGAANFLFDGFPQGGDQRPWQYMVFKLDRDTIERTWQISGELPKDNTPASIYRCAAFAADGSRIVAVNRTDYYANDAKRAPDFDADVIDAATGKQLAKVGAADGGQPARVNGWLGITPVASADAASAVMLLDGDSTALIVSPTDGKVVSRVAFPRRGVVTAAPFGAIPGTAGIIAGCEVGGNVWAVNALAGNAEEHLAWQHASGLIVKKIVTDQRHAAVIYWGGTVNVFDLKGEIVASNAFEQDIVDAAWSEGTLILADADGRVFGVNVK
ncbi:MAG TPA: hypothetical protein VM223_00345 [Planctomycetota bacterium]|nr:hypothetical protein [Planctomycetota bacterium]